MVRSRVFVFWAIAMCLAACLCVSAVDADDNKETEAEKAVEVLRELAKKELKSAEGYLRQANSMRSHVQSHQTSAYNAISQVSAVSNSNAKAAAIADEVKKTSNEVIGLYTKAHKAAEEAFKSLAAMVTKANDLVAQANVDTEPDSDSSSDYTKVNNEVLKVTAKVKEFQTKMKEEVKILQPASNLEFQMSGLVEKVQVKKYHFFVTLSVSKIDTVLKKADVDIGKTEEKRDVVNNALKEMRESAPNAPEKLTIYVNKMIQTAEGALFTASKAVDAAKKVKAEIMTIKTLADASLAKFEGEVKPDEVYGEIRQTKLYVEDVELKAPGIASALELAEITATNAETRKQHFISVISSDNTQPSGEADKITNKPSEPVKDTSTKPTSKDTGRPSEKKAEEPVRNGERSPVKNEKAIPSGANSDSAITVSFSLLLALLACASLH